MKRIAACKCFLNFFFTQVTECQIIFINLNQIFKIAFVFLNKLFIQFFVFYYCTLNNFIGLRKIIIQMNMGKSFTYTAPSVDFLFWKAVDIITDFFMADKHKMHLSASRPVAFFCKILKHLHIIA